MHMCRWGKRCALVFLLLVAVVLTAGCKGSRAGRTVSPTYLTKAGIIKPIAGATRRTIVICHFEAPEKGSDFGMIYTDITWGIGRHKTANLVLGNDLGEELAKAFSFQLQQAGFKTLVVSSPEALKEARKQHDFHGVLTGGVSPFDVSFTYVGGMGRGARGYTKCQIRLTRQDLTRVLATCEDESRDSVSAFAQGPTGLGSAVANQLITNVVDDICKMPEFQQALANIASSK